jgi:uncharacterized protein YndB with AHSA1/START domain
MMQITVKTKINASIDQVWESWTNPKHVMHWNFASEDWCCPAATNDLTVGSEFHYTMAAKDNSVSFDFWGTYQEILIHQTIEIILGDGRKMTVTFESTNDGVIVTEIFEPESENPVELQQAGWQLILDNFKKYVEA